MTSFSLAGKAIHFIGDNDPLPYGYRHNLLEAVGIILLEGARHAICLWQTDAANSTYTELLKKTTAVSLAILTAPFTVLGAGVKLIGQIVPHPIVECDDTIIPPVLSPGQIDQVYTLLQKFHEIASAPGVDLKYSMCSGTLLGALRHRGMIPWDDDADLCILDTEEEKLDGLASRFEAEGILLTKQATMDAYTLAFTPEKRKESFSDDSESVQLDIFIFTRVVDERGVSKITYKSPFFRAKWPQEYFTESEFEHLEGWDFGPSSRGLRLQGPSREHATSYLRRYYGEDCLTYGFASHRHVSIFGLHIGLPIVTRIRCKTTGQAAQGNIWR